MEKFIFRTRFKRNKKWGIDKIMNIINRNNIEFVTIDVTPYDNTILKISCDEKTYYNVFVKLVEKEYPGVCDFDI